MSADGEYIATNFNNMRNNVKPSFWGQRSKMEKRLLLVAGVTSALAVGFCAAFVLALLLRPAPAHHDVAYQRSERISFPKVAHCGNFLISGIGKAGCGFSAARATPASEDRGRMSSRRSQITRISRTN